jgi:tricorn protease-like protein
MGKSINTEVTEFCPSVSPDGKYLFFSSNRSLFSNYSREPITYEEKIRILNSAKNGSNDIYWVDAKIIEELKPQDINQ